MSERGDETGGLTETAQEVLVGVSDMAPDGGQLGTVGPDVLRGDDQAGIVDRLEGECDEPALLRIIRAFLLPCPGLRGCARRVGRSLLAVVRGRDDSKARPYRFGISAPRGVPYRKPPCELYILVLVAFIGGAVG